MIGIILSNETIFDIGGVYNSQNNRIWVINHAEIDTTDEIRRQLEFSQNISIWFAVNSKRVSHVFISEKGIVNHKRFSKEVLPNILKFRNNMFKNDGRFQSDNAKSHIHGKSLEWYSQSCSLFINKDSLQPNILD